MSGITARLHDLLTKADVEYEVIHHPVDVRAKTTAVDTNTPPSEFAKTVFVEIDDQYALAVMPATLSLSERRLAHSLGADRVRLASESQIASLCEDCELGAAPPFGNLYDLPVYVCPALARSERITFNAGTHSDAVRMAYADFERLANPQQAHMSRHEEDE